MATDPRSDEWKHQDMDEASGQWVTCQHCEGTGTQSGPGGDEECCHCLGRGERWFEFDDDAEMDLLDSHTGMTEDERRNIG